LTASNSLTYRDAGVDIDAGDMLVERIKPAAKRTMRPEVLAGIGGLGRSSKSRKNTANQYWFQARTALAQNSSWPSSGDGMTRWARISSP